ncbi:MAG: hypothetical protein DELT_00325 [Desulfovibrio sp.]
MEMDLFFPALLKVCTSPVMLGCIILGMTLGFIFGALPGLTATLGVALLTPLTFPLPAEQALAMMIALYCGAMTGGAIPAILLNIPGTPSAVVTTLDGFPMAKKGHSTRAYGWALLASMCGGLLSWLALATLAPLLARWALKLGSPEYAAVALLGMTIIATISPGRVLRGLIAALIGLGLSVVGFDQISGEGRWMFNSLSLSKGIGIMPALIGFLVIPEIINSIAREVKMDNIPVTIRNLFPPLKEILQQKWCLIRSGLIGIFVGMIPAVGGSVAAFLSYDQAKRYDKDGDKYGTGMPGGIIASEAANNGVSGGALIPLLTLGIPGDAVTAMLIGGLMIHGLQPGPRLFSTSGDIMWLLIASILVANVLMGAVGVLGFRFFVKAMSLRNYFKVPALLVLTIVGTYSLSNLWFDVLVMLILGVCGFIMMLGNFPVYPIVIGIILGPVFESETRRALTVSGGDWAIFVTRPVSATVLALTMLMLFGPPLVRAFKKQRQP